MKALLFSFAILLGSCMTAAHAETRTLCTIVLNAESGARLIEEGDCESRMSPASTFKIAISLMGYDAGILKDASSPVLPFKKGYVDWRPNWRKATSPRTWMRDSVVWYSQQVTTRLGEKRYSDYVSAFGYGNEDVSGDPGKHNGLTDAWLSSSLQISPLEQVAFLRRLVRGELPVSEEAVKHTAEITDYGRQPAGWHVHGKTGAGLPRGADGALLRGRPFGWFVGWAEKNGRSVVFARLIQDSRRQTSPPGFRARDGILENLFTNPAALEQAF
ncbi:class D beta-lactamase [uncultured Roseibium sp.]|uniref:class D beta-lactamase n=1 Tax=uncultured Roseibium sp. TaxID=1936171 RepID=UPI003217F62F